MRRSIPSRPRRTAAAISTIMIMADNDPTRRHRPEVRASEAREPRRTESAPSFEAGLRPAPQDDGAAAEPSALYRLMAWLSPAYPVGAFSYSSGIEWAVESGDIADAETLQRWLTVIVSNGGGFCDAVFFVHAHRA